MNTQEAFGCSKTCLQVPVKFFKHGFLYDKHAFSTDVTIYLESYCFMQSAVQLSK